MVIRVARGIEAHQHVSAIAGEVQRFPVPDSEHVPRQVEGRGHGLIDVEPPQPRSAVRFLLFGTMPVQEVDDAPAVFPRKAQAARARPRRPFFSLGKLEDTKQLQLVDSSLRVPVELVSEYLARPVKNKKTRGLGGDVIERHTADFRVLMG